MENPTKDTPCNNGPFSYNLRMQYEMDRIVQPLMKRIEQLEEKVRVMGSMKPMGQPCPDRPPAADEKPAAKNEDPTYRLKLNFVFPQMGTLQNILESNGVYGPPPRQPVHNGWLRAALRSLCEYNYNRKDYANQNEPKTKKNEILAKTTPAMPTDHPTKPTKKTE
jgi:hypothetical protein